MPLVKLRFDAPLEDHNPDEALSDRVRVRQALAQALMEGDTEAFKEILRGHINALNKEHVVRVSGVSRTTLFRMLEPGSNPTLENVAKVCKAINDEDVQAASA